MAAEKTARKQRTRGRPFVPGRSGNPRGRPRGARNASTVLAEQMLDGEAPALIRKAVQKAKQGNVPALRMLLDRILPIRRQRPVSVALPSLTKASDATAALAQITAAVASGELTPAEASELAALVSAYVKVLEACDFDARLRALEENQPQPNANAATPEQFGDTNGHSSIDAEAAFEA